MFYPRVVIETHFWSRLSLSTVHDYLNSYIKQIFCDYSDLYLHEIFGTNIKFSISTICINSGSPIKLRNFIQISL